MKGPAPPRRAAVVFAILASALPAAAAPGLVRLAEGFAAELVRAARGRPVEVAVPEDRTGRGAALALDLRALVLDRLQGRATVTESGPRLRVQSVLSESATGLVVSARIVEEPGGRLVDLVSVSAPADETLHALAPLRDAPSPGDIHVLSTSRTPPLDEAVLDLAFFGDDRLVVLGPDSVALYRFEGEGLALESRRPLSGPQEQAVRFPGGMLRVAEGDGAFWALTSRSSRALLFAVEDGRLVERQEAEALPWPGCLAGLRYRRGTNLVEGTIAEAAEGPFLGLDDAAPGVAVTADGVLRVGTAAGLPAGPALSSLWPGVVVASSAQPPGESDVIQIVSTSGSGTPRILDSLRVEGAVRALAGRMGGKATRLAAAVQGPDRATRLVVMDLARQRP